MMSDTRTSAGMLFESSASRALTASDTATVFWPDCLSTSKETASAPLARTMVRSSSWPSSTRATSRRRTAEPSRAVATITSRRASTLPSSPIVRTLTSRGPCSKRPPGTARFAVFNL